MIPIHVCHFATWINYFHNIIIYPTTTGFPFVSNNALASACMGVEENMGVNNIAINNVSTTETFCLNTVIFKQLLLIFGSGAKIMGYEKIKAFLSELNYMW
jgi:hypothetical protein